MSKELKKSVKAKKISVNKWRENAMKSKMSEYQIQTLIKMFDYYEKYNFKGNPNVLKLLIRREPTTVKKFLKTIFKPDNNKIQ